MNYREKVRLANEDEPGLDKYLSCRWIIAYLIATELLGFLRNLPINLGLAEEDQVGIEVEDEQKRILILNLNRGELTGQVSQSSSL